MRVALGFTSSLILNLEEAGGVLRCRYLPEFFKFNPRDSGMGLRDDIGHGQCRRHNVSYIFLGIFL